MEVTLSAIRGRTSEIINTSKGYALKRLSSMQCLLARVTTSFNERTIMNCISYLTVNSFRQQTDCFVSLNLFCTFCYVPVSPPLIFGQLSLWCLDSIFASWYSTKLWYLRFHKSYQNVSKVEDIVNTGCWKYFCCFTKVFYLSSWFLQTSCILQECQKTPNPCIYLCRNFFHWTSPSPAIRDDYSVVWVVVTWELGLCLMVSFTLLHQRWPGQSRRVTPRHKESNTKDLPQIYAMVPSKTGNNCDYQLSCVFYLKTRE